MVNIKALFVLVLFFVIISTASFIVNFSQDWVETQTYGQKYCFEDGETVKIAVATQGAQLSWQKEEGDSFCFRTKDKAFVQNVTQQIQDRKQAEEIAKIESRTILFTILLIILGIIAIIFLIWFLFGNSYPSL